MVELPANGLGPGGSESSRDCPWHRRSYEPLERRGSSSRPTDKPCDRARPEFTPEGVSADSPGRLSFSHGSAARGLCRDPSNTENPYQAA